MARLRRSRVRLHCAYEEDLSDLPSHGLGQPRKRRHFYVCLSRGCEKPRNSKPGSKRSAKPSRLALCLTKEVQEIKAQRDASQSAYHSLANATSEYLPPEQAQKAIDQSLNSNPEAAKIIPRIYIHIRATSQRARASQIAEALRQKGFVVPGVQILVSKGPDETEVRYFHDADQREAAKIAQDLAGAGVPNAKPTLISNYPNVRPRQYEIWFTRELL